jgi:glycosyltransferase involved in cell wall biosynthesis
MTELAVHHFGPDPAYVGGMGSVLRVLTENQIGGDSVVLHPTWRPESPATNAWLASRALTAIPRLPRRRIAHVHLSERGSFIREGAVLAAARMRGHGAVATIHGADFLPFAEAHPRLVERVLRQAHLVTCLDTEIHALLERRLTGTVVELLPNPVLLDRDSGSAGDTEEVVLFAGEISSRKGADVLARAWEEVTAVRDEAICLMVGPPADLELPRLERLQVRAPVGAEEVRELVRMARVVVLPSRAEGMPMILTEALAAGRPFVSTPVGGIPQLARAGGKLVPVGDAPALAAALIELLESCERAAVLGEEGRAYCASTRSSEVIDRRLRQMYGEVLDRRN